MAKASLPNADARKELFWKMEDTWVTSSKVFSFLRVLMTEYISNDDSSKPKPKPTVMPMEIPDEKLDYLNKKITGYKDIAISEAGINYKSNWWHLFHL